MHQYNKYVTEERCDSYVKAKGAKKVNHNLFIISNLNFTSTAQMCELSVNQEVQ